VKRVENKAREAKKKSREFWRTPDEAEEILIAKSEATFLFIVECFMNNILLFMNWDFPPGIRPREGRASEILNVISAAFFAAAFPLPLGN
jgi:hypothetical protein